MTTADVIDLFFDFTGRISRSAWWLAFITVLVFQIGVGSFIDPAYYSSESGERVSPTFGGMLWNLAVCIPGLAITFKRLNDRNFPQILGYVLAVMTVVLYVGEYFGFFLDTQPQLTLESVLFWTMALFSLVILIDNGFFRGTDGPNRYGADPLDNV